MLILGKVGEGHLSSENRCNTKKVTNLNHCLCSICFICSICFTHFEWNKTCCNVKYTHFTNTLYGHISKPGAWLWRPVFAWAQVLLVRPASVVNLYTNNHRCLLSVINSARLNPNRVSLSVSWNEEETRTHSNRCCCAARHVGGHVCVFV